MNTTEAVKHGTALLDTTTQAVSDIADRAGELADKAKKQAGAVATEAVERLSDRMDTKKRPTRRRKVLLFGAVAGLAVGVANYARKTTLGRKVEDRVIDLTGGRTSEAAFERLGADGLDPVTRGEAL